MKLQAEMNIFNEAGVTLIHCLDDDDYEMDNHDTKDNKIVMSIIVNYEMDEL